MLSQTKGLRVCVFGTGWQVYLTGSRLAQSGCSPHQFASQKPVESVSGKYFDLLGLVKLLLKSCNKVCNLGTEGVVVTR